MTRWLSKTPGVVLTHLKLINEKVTVLLILVINCVIPQLKPQWLIFVTHLGLFHYCDPMWLVCFICVLSLSWLLRSYKITIMSQWPRMGWWIVDGENYHDRSYLMRPCWLGSTIKSVSLIPISRSLFAMTSIAVNSHLSLFLWLVCIHYLHNCTPIWLCMYPYLLLILMLLWNVTIGAAIRVQNDYTFFLLFNITHTFYVDIFS